MVELNKSLPELFESCRDIFPATLKEDSWYLVVATALITLSDPCHIADLYKYLIKESKDPSIETRKVLNRRLREFILKSWVTIGVPRAAVAFWGLMEVEQVGDADLGLRKKYTALDAGNHQRGLDFFFTIFGQERGEALVAEWGKDMEWLTIDVVYGLFHADDGVLNMLETEFITYTAIICQSQHVPYMNHIMGLKRMGLNAAEVEGITACAQTVANWCGHDTTSWKSVHESITWE